MSGTYIEITIKKRIKIQDPAPTTEEVQEAMDNAEVEIHFPETDYDDLDTEIKWRYED